MAYRAALVTWYHAKMIKITSDLFGWIKKLLASYMLLHFPEVLFIESILPKVATPLLIFWRNKNLVDIHDWIFPCKIYSGSANLMKTVSTACALSLCLL